MVCFLQMSHTRCVSCRYLMLMEGSDAEVDLNRHSAPEFSEWKWIPLPDTLQKLAPYKQDVYRLVLSEFGPLVDKHLIQGRWR